MSASPGLSGPAEGTGGWPHVTVAEWRVSRELAAGLLVHAPSLLTSGPWDPGTSSAVTSEDQASELSLRCNGFYFIENARGSQTPGVS